MFDRLKAAWAALRRIDGMELPDAGRSSVEPLSDRLNSLLNGLGSVSPIIDFQMLACLKQLWLFNPDLSQYVSNLVNLGNTGHQVTVDAANSSRAEATINRINESASRIYTNGAGVDGLINAYISQIAWSGALSSEDVVNFAARRVEQVVLVPVEQIRFQLIDDKYRPFQQSGFGLGLSINALGRIPLNEFTYHYYALQTVENSPYAKPPATAAVDDLTGPQTDAKANIKYIVKKLGLLGLVSVAVAPPRQKPNEDETQFNSRAQAYLARVRKALDGSFMRGLLVHFLGQQVNHSNVASDARGSSEIFRVIEEQVMSGLAMQPAFFGRTDSTTETYAGVVYNLLTAQVGNIQRLPKRRQEATYRLDLRLAGIEVDGVSLSFNRPHVLKPLEDAQAEQIRVQTALIKARAGIISPDQAAQEMGYDSAFDPELISSHPDVANSLQRMKVGAGRALDLMTATFRFDRSAQRYRFVPQRIELNGDPVEAETYVPVHKFAALKKKAA
jgi:hypothetical protein